MKCYSARFRMVSILCRSIKRIRTNWNRVIQVMLYNFKDFMLFWTLEFTVVTEIWIDVKVTQCRNTPIAFIFSMRLFEGSFLVSNFTKPISTFQMFTPLHLYSDESVFSPWLESQDQYRENIWVLQDEFNCQIKLIQLTYLNIIPHRWLGSAWLDSKFYGIALTLF